MNMHGVAPKDRSGLAPGAANVPAAVGLAVELQRARSELADAKQALASSRQHIQTLTETNFRLSRELAEIVRKEAEVRDFAYHDHLTGLPNRRLLFDRLKQAVALAARQHKQVVLLLLDLDGFKSVNDTLGHAGGDKLLQAVARRLAAGIRGADTACRYGGDEFLIMLPEVDDPGTAASVRQKLTLALGEPYTIDGYQIHLTASVGGVAYPTDGQTDEALIRKADDALYRAKARSANISIKALPRDTWIAETQRLATFLEPTQVRNDDLEVQ